MKLYSLDNKFIGDHFSWPDGFTGIVEYKNGSRWWLLEEKYHRLDGPAICSATGNKQWWINDKQITELEHKLLYDMMKLKGLL